MFSVFKNNKDVVICCVFKYCKISYRIYICNILFLIFFMLLVFFCFFVIKYFYLYDFFLFWVF